MLRAAGKTFEAMTQAMIDNDVDQGHIGTDAPVWGRYESNARAALLVIKRRFAGTPCDAAVDSILKGES